MKSSKQKRISSFKPVIIAVLIGLLAISCKKEVVEPQPEPEPTGRSAGMVPYYKLQRVENLPAETDDQNPTAPKTEILFSLDYKRVQPDSYAKTSLWDISLSGLYNSFIGGNNNSDATNSGYRGPGKGGVLISTTLFEEVADIPVASSFRTGKGLIGTDDAGAFGEGTGWYLYDYEGKIVSDGRDDKKHVAYALGSPLKLANGNTIPARTIIVKTASGDYAKIKMISCYKDVFKADQMFKDSPHMYFTFEYVIVPASSTKFEIK